MKIPSLMLRQTVTVQDRTPDLGDGPGWGPERILRCRIDWGRTLVRGPQGDDITVTGTMLIRPEETIEVGARVTVDGDARTVFAVNPIFGPSDRLTGRQVLLK